MSEIAESNEITGGDAPKKRVRRRFFYSGIELADPNPEWDERKVKDFYVGEYPALANATVTMPEGGIVDTGRAIEKNWQFREGVAPKPTGQSGQSAGEKTIEFKTSVGRKG